MKKAIDIDETDLTDFESCLNKCSSCDCLVTLKKFIQVPNGEFNQLEIDKHIIPTKNSIKINNNYIYLTLNPVQDFIYLKKIKSLWEQYLDRGTENFMQNKGNDFAFLLDLVTQDIENHLAYVLSFINPIFMAFDDETLEIAFTMDCMRYEIAEIDYAYLQGEIDYEVELEKDTDNYKNNNDNDYEEDVISNEEWFDI